MAKSSIDIRQKKFEGDWFTDWMIDESRYSWGNRRNINIEDILSMEELVGKMQGNYKEKCSGKHPYSRHNPTTKGIRKKSSFLVARPLRRGGV